MVDKHNYSVPYQYVGQKVSVLWDLDTVEVCSGSSRIAIHQRRQGSGYSTLDAHMPDKHLAYKHGQGYNAAYALLHDEVFYNLPSMNARIYELMLSLIHIYTGIFPKIDENSKVYKDYQLAENGDNEKKVKGWFYYGVVKVEGKKADETTRCV